MCMCTCIHNFLLQFFYSLCTCQYVQFIQFIIMEKLIVTRKLQKQCRRSGNVNSHLSGGTFLP